MAEQEKNAVRELIPQVAGSFAELMKEFERIELAMAERSAALARAETTVSEREKQCAERERLVTIRETESRHVTQIASERLVMMKTAQEAAQQCNAARKQAEHDRMVAVKEKANLENVMQTLLAEKKVLTAQNERLAAELEDLRKRTGDLATITLDAPATKGQAEQG